MVGRPKGYFDELRFYCLIGFLKDNIDALVDTSGEGIFEWPQYILDWMKERNFANTEEEKRLMMVSYLFEFVYDLMLAPGDNVSLNPGFERCTGFLNDE